MCSEPPNFLSGMKDQDPTKSDHKADELINSSPKNPRSSPRDLQLAFLIFHDQVELNKARQRFSELKKKLLT